jgi:hypothetical protein
MSGILFSLALELNAIYGVLGSRCSLITLNDAPYSVRLLWTVDQLVAETSNLKHTTNTIFIHDLGGNGTHDRSRRATVDRANHGIGERVT